MNLQKSPRPKKLSRTLYWPKSVPLPSNRSACYPCHNELRASCAMAPIVARFRRRKDHYTSNKWPIIQGFSLTSTRADTRIGKISHQTNLLTSTAARLRWTSPRARGTTTPRTIARIHKGVVGVSLRVSSPINRWIFQLVGRTQSPTSHSAWIALKTHLLGTSWRQSTRMTS